MSPEPPLRTGECLAGRYVLRAHVGGGPLGACYLADDMEAACEVVLKVIAGKLLPTDAARARFVRHALRFRAASSPYLARLVEVFVGTLAAEAEGRAVDHAVVVFERLPGFTLRRLMERRSERGMGAFPARDLRLIVGQLASALDAIHRAGLAHGNVKPENVFLTAAGVRLGDLAIAPALGASAFVGAQSQRCGGRYLPPEVCRGAPFQAAADVYALGVTLWELVGLDVAGQSHASVSAGLLGVLERARAEDPATRFPDASSLAAAFIRAGREDTDEESPGPEPERTSVGVSERAPAARRRARERVITAMGRAVSALTDDDIEQLEATTVFHPPSGTGRPGAARDLASAVASELARREQDATVRVPAPRDESAGADGHSTTRPVRKARADTRRTPVLGGSAGTRSVGSGAAAVAARPRTQGAEQRTVIGAPETLARRSGHHGAVPAERRPHAIPAATTQAAVSGSMDCPPQRAAGAAARSEGAATRRKVEIPELTTAAEGRGEPTDAHGELTPLLTRTDSGPVSSRSVRRMGPGALVAFLLGLAATSVLALGLARNVVSNREAEREAVARVEKARRVEALRARATLADTPAIVAMPAVDAAATSLVADASAACARGMVPIAGVARPFCMSAHEFPGPGRPPRTGVTVAEAARLCSESGGRLCSSEEWDLACTGAGLRRYPYGEELSSGACNLGRRGGAVVAAAGRHAACRTPEGVHDMLGNVSEWVAEGVARGGDARLAADGVTCSHGVTLGAEERSDRIGFRCCADAP